MFTVSLIFILFVVQLKIPRQIYLYSIHLYIYRPFAEADFAFSCVCAGEAKAAGENLHNTNRINVIQLE